MNLVGATILTWAALTVAATAQPPPLEPEALAVEPRIRPGPNVFVQTESWRGAGAVNVLSGDDLSYKGDISTGLGGQFTLVDDGRSGFVVSAYPRRIMSGPVEAVLQAFDVSTLKMGPEVRVSDKLAHTFGVRGILQVTPSRRFALIQNATPATSVSVVDLRTQRQVGEIPTPGCWSIIMAVEADRFSTICGDGALLTIRLGPSGKAEGQARSEPFFDPDKDPIFTHVERVGADLLFVSYAGVLHRVSDSGDKAREIGKFAFAQGVQGRWAPGGFQIMAYNAPGDVLFVSMHPDAKDGSHKSGSKEIWAVDLGRGRVLYRSAAEGFTRIAVTQDAQPVLFAVNAHDGKVARFEADPTAKFAAKRTHEIALREAGGLRAP